VLLNVFGGSPLATLSLPDGSGGSYVTYNTVSAVETATGARIYDSTADCPTGGGCSPSAQLGGRLYAIDVTSPSTAGGTPTLAVAWHYDFEGPSGASPMVLPTQSGAPVGDQVYFDGSGPTCASPCGQPEHPTLFAVQDQGAGGATTMFSVDFTTQFGAAENGYCPLAGGGTVYLGIQAAPALEGPEASGSDRNNSVWAFAACGPTLYRFDAQGGAQWAGSGASTINIPTVTGLNGYLPSSTMNTLTDATTGHTAMFVGAQQAPASINSYVLALDLETGGQVWSVRGPTTVLNNADTPFNGQFPIAKTSAGGYVLIATTAGSVDGSRILGIPLS
jgi:hypothetical protein